MATQSKLGAVAPYHLPAPAPQRGPVVSVQVAVTPQKKFTEDGNIILLGFLDETEVEVVFKRDEAIRPLLTQLTQLLKTARARSAAADGQVPNASSLRCPLYVEGVWRVRLVFDQNDMPVRRYQLHAARWRVRRADGSEQIGGQKRGA